MKLPFPDLPNSSTADTPPSSPGYELKPAASLHPASHDDSLENLFVPLISITPSKCNDFHAPALLTRVSNWSSSVSFAGERAKVALCHAGWLEKSNDCSVKDLFNVSEDLSKC